MVKIVHICGGLFLVLYLLYPNAVIIEECYEIIVLFYKMSKNSNKFTVQEVNMVLENQDDEIGSSDNRIAEDEGDDDGAARGTVEASNRDESDDDGDNFIGRRSQKRPSIPSSDSEKEGETSHVESNRPTAPWTWTSYDDKIL